MPGYADGACESVPWFDSAYASRSGRSSKLHALPLGKIGFSMGFDNGIDGPKQVPFSLTFAPILRRTAKFTSSTTAVSTFQLLEPSDHVPDLQSIAGPAD